MVKFIYGLLFLLFSSSLYAQKNSGFVLTNVDTIPVSCNFTTKKIFGNKYLAIWVPLGTITLNGQNFALDSLYSIEENKVTILQKDSVFTVFSMELKAYLDTLKPQKTIHWDAVFRDANQFNTSRNIGAMGNIAGLKRWLGDSKLMEVQDFLANMDDDADLEHLFYFRADNERSALMVVDKGRNGWVCESFENFNTYGAIDGQFFDAKNKLWVKETGFESNYRWRKNQESEPNRVETSEMYWYYHHKKWEPCFSAKKQGSFDKHLGKYRFSMQYNTSFFWHKADSLSSITTTNVTGGWFDEPQIWYDTIIYKKNQKTGVWAENYKSKLRLRKEVKVGKKWETEFEEQGIDFGKIPTETWLDTTVYDIGTDKTKKLLEIETQKIVEKNNVLNLEILKTSYFFMGKTWVYKPKKKRFEFPKKEKNLLLLKNNHLLYIASKSLRAAILKNTDAQLYARETEKIPRKTIELLRKNKFAPDLWCFIANNKYIDFEKNYTIDFFDFDDKKLILLWAETLNKACFITINDKTNAVLNIKSFFSSEKPVFKNKLIFHVIKNTNLYDITGLHVEKWINNKWHEVLTQHYFRKNPYAELYEELSQNITIKNDTIYEEYRYKWATLDDSTLLFLSKPYFIKWGYNKYRAVYEKKNTCCFSKLNPENLAQMEYAIFMDNLDKIKALQTTGTPKQKELLARYLDFYIKNENPHLNKNPLNFD